ncbi:MAG: calcium/sodium antiporter [Gammaproteobacteria bacterium]|nr:calcium/sodium antiporter [Gammaproteobacteria bacterium]
MIDIAYLLAGLALLTAGGEALIRGALSAANRIGISPLLSGLLIVGFGTSAPELVVSVDAAINHKPDIAIGNVVGSNIGNVLLILGICALIRPLDVSPLGLRRDAVVMVTASLLFVVMAFNGTIGRIDAMVLWVFLLIYLVWAYQTEKSGSVPSAEVHKAESEELSALPASALGTGAMVVIGLVLLIAGSRLLLTGAVSLAEHFGLSQAIIGLTLVAVGTSLPELSISVIAAIRGHADVAVGNVMGSNIFNVLGILGVSAFLHPLPVPARILHFDQWFLLATALLIFFFLYTSQRVTRLEGGVLLIGYLAYLGSGFFFFSN